MAMARLVPSDRTALVGTIRLPALEALRQRGSLWRRFALAGAGSAAGPQAPEPPA